MKSFEEVKKEQKKRIEVLRFKTLQFIENRIKPIDEINGCLLSGSVARGDYFPGELNGAIDLTIFVRDKTKFDIVKYFGKSESEIKLFQMVKDDEQFYQLRFYDNKYFKNYESMEESAKYAVNESIIIYDKNNEIKKKIEYIKHNIINGELKELYLDRIEYSKYLINEYKVDRWKRRDAIIQLFQNLSKAIEISIKCLFNINGFYAPAEDRALYYSYALKKIPKNFKEFMDKLVIINELNFEAYYFKEKLYKEVFLDFIEKEIGNEFNHKYCLK